MQRLLKGQKEKRSKGRLWGLGRHGCGLKAVEDFTDYSGHILNVAGKRCGAGQRPVGALVPKEGALAPTFWAVRHRTLACFAGFKQVRF